MHSAPKRPPFEPCTAAPVDFVLTLSFRGRFRLRWVARHHDDTALPQACRFASSTRLVETNCDERDLDSEIPVTVASGKRAEYRAESKVALPRAGVGADLVCMTSLLARNHGKRLGVSGSADEFGHHGESVDGALMTDSRKGG